MDYRRDIDGLRALAITPVVAFHYGVPGFTGGYVGVDIFFVISGFLIGGIILREVAEGTFTYANFYARRARRIVPALLAVLTASSVFAVFVLSPRELQLFGKVAAASVVGLSNIAIWSEINYFADTAELNPLLMT
ncbi:MAG TPA: acyltransferase, partial [Povalibacter sp.]